MTTVAEDRAVAQARTDSTLATAQGYLDALTNAANVIFSNPGFNIDDLIPASYNYASVSEIFYPIVGGGIRPDVSDLSIAGPPEAPTLSFETLLEDIALPADDLLAPTNDFEFFEQAYVSSLLDPLTSKLLNDLLNGGYGIDTADEAALYQRALDREVAATQARIDTAGRAFASRGFPLPPGELAVTIDRAYQEQQAKMSSVSREIFIDSAKRFVENRRFTIEQVRQLEQVTMGFHNSIQERALNAARATAEVGIAVYNALVSRFRARLEAAKITSEVQYQRVQAEVARAQAYLENFRGQIAGYEASIRGQVEPLRLKTELYRADIDGNRAIMDATLSQANLQQEVIKSTTQQNIQISNLAIENAKAKLLATVEALKFQTEAAKFGAAEFFATITAMLGSINSLGVQTATD